VLITGAYSPSDSSLSNTPHADTLLTPLPPHGAISRGKRARYTTIAARRRLLPHNVTGQARRVRQEAPAQACDLAACPPDAHARRARHASAGVAHAQGRARAAPPRRISPTSCAAAARPAARMATRAGVRARPAAPRQRRSPPRSAPRAPSQGQAPADHRRLLTRQPCHLCPHRLLS